ncbi:MAG TPA: STAS domain-containing protein [Anaerolineales bacterium]
MNPGMTIRVSSEQGRVPVTVFHVSGDIDGNTYEQFQVQAAQTAESGTHDLLIDLSQVGYVSSAGLRAIHYVFNLLRSNTPEESDEAMRKGLMDGSFKSPHLKLLNPNPAVTTSLKTAGFDMYLAIYHNLKEAVDSY